MKTRNLFLMGGKGQIQDDRILVEREILRAGEYATEAGPWRVTLPDLVEIQWSYQLGHVRGLDTPLTVGLSDDVRDRVGRFGSLQLRGDSLWGVLSIRASEAGRVRRLRDVRVEVRENFVDGLGNAYRLAMTNVGLVPAGEGSKLLSRF